MTEPDLTDMDYVKDAIFNALFSGLDLEDVAAMIYDARTAEGFNEAVNLLTLSYGDR